MDWECASARVGVAKECLNSAAGVVLGRLLLVVCNSELLVAFRCLVMSLAEADLCIVASSAGKGVTIAGLDDSQVRRLLLAVARTERTFPTACLAILTTL